MSGDLGPVWIRADEQTAGRGRRGRDWVSSKGNLFCTGLYAHDGDIQHAALLSFVAALAVYDLAAAYVPENTISLKWPNDVLIGGAKTSGILLESGHYKGQLWTAIGIGVNLVSHPDNIDYAATHLAAHIPAEDLAGAEPKYPEPQAALAILSAAFDARRREFMTLGFAPIRQAWLERAGNIPGPVTVRLPGETFEGQATDLGEKGELRVRLENGTVRDVYAGDVFFAAADKG